jgi:hypothetical protein
MELVHDATNARLHVPPCSLAPQINPVALLGKSRRPVAIRRRTLPDFIASLYLHPADQVLQIDVLRGVSRMSLNVAVTVYHEKIGQLGDIPDLQRSLAIPES